MLENSEDTYLSTFTLNKLLIVACAITYFTECRRHLGVKNALEGMKWEAINDTITIPPDSPNQEVIPCTFPS